jgi:hypothetical protein
MAAKKASSPTPNLTLRREVQALWNTLEEHTSGLVTCELDSLEAMQDLVESIAKAAGFTLSEYSGSRQKAYRAMQRESGTRDDEDDPDDDEDLD